MDRTTTLEMLERAGANVDDRDVLAWLEGNHRWISPLWDELSAALARLTAGLDAGERHALARALRDGQDLPEWTEREPGFAEAAGRWAEALVLLGERRPDLRDTSLFATLAHCFGDVRDVEAADRSPLGWYPAWSRHVAAQLAGAELLNLALETALSLLVRPVGTVGTDEFVTRGRSLLAELEELLAPAQDEGWGADPSVCAVMDAATLLLLGLGKHEPH